MSYDDLKAFLQERVAENELDGTFLRWDRIHTQTPGRRMGLQIADAVATGFFKAVELTEYGFTEDRYARILKPVVFRRDSIYMGFGLRFWPSEIVEERSVLAWVREVFCEEED